jgi:hypothetical protein
MIGGLISATNYKYHDGTNAPQPKLGINHPPLGGYCGTTPPPTFSGGETIGLLHPLLHPITTFIDFCYVIGPVYVH